jgi:hypothetical protein
MSGDLTRKCTSGGYQLAMPPQVSVAEVIDRWHCGLVSECQGILS